MKKYSKVKKEIFSSLIEESFCIATGKSIIFSKHKILRRIAICFMIPVVILRNLKVLIVMLYGNKLYIDHIECVITTHCSLKCKHCANLIQYYEHPYHISKQDIIDSLRQFASIPDYIRRIRILGGEPLLHPDLADIIDYVCTLDNLKTVELVTNGTIVPKRDKLTKSLQNKKVILYISDYGKNSSHKKELLDYCRCNHITAIQAFSNDLWDDYGNTLCRNRTEEELQEQLSNCNTRCYTLLKGKLHICPHSSNGEDLGLFHCNSSEYVDIFSEYSLEEKKKELYEFIYKGPTIISACNYCDNGVNSKNKKVVPGEQM